MIVRTVGLFLAAILILLGVTGCEPAGEKLPSQGGAAVEQPSAAGFSIPSLRAGGTKNISLSSYAGQVLLLDFWATWCPPCRFEIPALNKLQHQLEDRGFSLIGMTVDRGGLERVARAVQEFDLSYPVGLVGEDVQRLYGGIRAVPTKVLLDKQGRIRKRYEGVVPVHRLRVEIEQLLAE